ncbi:P-loop containing nucleoside triphosphate hydrolase protein [Mycena vitilis]|nr:P-loop containing nucleoside triphosphate hydrolase protein [Mycena vitilis]
MSTVAGRNGGAGWRSWKQEWSIATWGNERYLNVTLSRDNNITTGKIYKEVTEKERKGIYLGKTVQNAIQHWIQRVAQIPVDDTGDVLDVCIVEFQFRVGHDNFALVHVSLVPDMHGEQKTKPTQTMIHSLRGLGFPDSIACRLLGPQPLQPATKEKISMFCHVAPEQVLGVHYVSSVYHVPLLQSQGIVDYLRKRLKLPSLNISREMWQKGESLHKRWKDMATGQERLFDSVSVALHSAFRVHRKRIIHWVESPDLKPEMHETNPAKYLDAWRAVVGAGICLGFQLAVIEWARNVLGIAVHDTPSPLIIFMPEISRTHMGSTMRLGLRPTVFEPGTETYRIWERHRHQYEVNPDYVHRLHESGLILAGKDEKGERMQAHPEFCTRRLNPSPPFSGFIAAPSGLAVFDEQLDAPSSLHR